MRHCGSLVTGFAITKMLKELAQVLLRPFENLQRSCWWRKRESFCAKNDSLTRP